MNARDQVYRLQDGRKLSVTQYGCQHGAAVFCFHGTPASQLQFATFDSTAKTLGIRLLAIDRPGYGNSDFEQKRTLVSWPADVSAIADVLKIDNFGLIGIAGGGPYALACAHSLKARLTGVVVVCCNAPGDNSESLADMLPGERIMLNMSYRWPFFAYLLMKTQEIVLRRARSSRLIQFARKLPSPDRQMFDRAEYRSLVRQEAICASKTSAKAAVQDFALYRDWGFRLEEISIPVELFHGAMDANVPLSHARQLADRLPKGKLHIYPRHGHLSILDERLAILHSVVSAATTSAGQ